MRANRSRRPDMPATPPTVTRSLDEQREPSIDTAQREGGGGKLKGHASRCGRFDEERPRASRHHLHLVSRPDGLEPLGSAQPGTRDHGSPQSVHSVTTLSDDNRLRFSWECLLLLRLVEGLDRWFTMRDVRQSTGPREGVRGQGRPRGTPKRAGRRGGSWPGETISGGDERSGTARRQGNGTRRDERSVPSIVRGSTPPSDWRVAGSRRTDLGMPSGTRTTRPRGLVRSRSSSWVARTQKGY